MDELLHCLMVEPYSEAEEFIVKYIMPKCRDKHYVVLGIMVNKPYNEYKISHSDYVRCHEFIKTLKGEN